MDKILEKVIKTLIIPRHPEIVDFKVTNRVSTFLTWYIIDYTIKVDDPILETKLRELSYLLFDMLGVRRNVDVRVWFTVERNFFSND
jgi:hypothetical protein